MRSFANRILKKMALIAFASFALFIATGCSSFNREWRDAENHFVPTIGLEGRWEGQWASDVNHHHGKLRCIIEREGNICQARFQAKYQKILSFGYTVTLNAETSENG